MATKTRAELDAEASALGLDPDDFANKDEIETAIGAAQTVTTAGAPGSTRHGVDIIPTDLAILNEDIDTRMAALLKDHQRMGARPK